MNVPTVPNLGNINDELRDAFASDNDFVTGEQLINKGFTKIPALLEPLLPKVGIAGLVGGSDVGKSTALRQLAVAIVVGQPQCLGFDLNPTHNSAVVVSTEDDEASVAYLLGQMPQVINNCASAFQKLRFVFDTDNLLSKLDRMLDDTPTDVVVIDAFGDLFMGRTSESSQVRLFLNEYLNLAKKHNCLILFLHHTGKYKDELVPSKHHVLGSQAFEAKMRIILELRADNYDTELRHLCVLKGNYLPSSYKLESYVLRLNSNLQLTATNERVPIEQLAKPRESTGSNGGYTAEKHQKATELKDVDKKTYQEIADELGYLNKSDITKLFKKFDPKQV